MTLQLISITHVPPGARWTYHRVQAESAEGNTTCARPVVALGIAIDPSSPEVHVPVQLVEAPDGTLSVAEDARAVGSAAADWLGEFLGAGTTAAPHMHALARFDDLEKACGAFCLARREDIAR